MKKIKTGREKGEMKGEWIKMELNALLCPRPNEHQHPLGSQLFFLHLSRLNKEKQPVLDEYTSSCYTVL